MASAKYHASESRGRTPVKRARGVDSITNADEKHGANTGPFFAFVADVKGPFTSKKKSALPYVCIIMYFNEGKALHEVPC